jgi:hypothetical protein
MINQYFEKWLKIIEKIHFLFVPGYSSYRQISEAGKITFILTSDHITAKKLI